jgi:hypothetical protein
LPILWFRGPGVTAHNGAYVVSRGAISKNTLGHTAELIDLSVRSGIAPIADGDGFAEAGDLPVEQPQKFQLIVNLKTTKALGITIPQSIVVRSDKVIP